MDSQSSSKVLPCSINECNRDVSTLTKTPEMPGLYIMDFEVPQLMEFFSMSGP
jgi:hypothetical protein